jgi:hypothetical protein
MCMLRSWVGKWFAIRKFSKRISWVLPQWISRLNDSKNWRLTQTGSWFAPQPMMTVLDGLDFPQHLAVSPNENLWLQVSSCLCFFFFFSSDTLGSLSLQMVREVTQVHYTLCQLISYTLFCNLACAVGIAVWLDRHCAFFRFICVRLRRMGLYCAWFGRRCSPPQHCIRSFTSEHMVVVFWWKWGSRVFIPRKSDALGASFGPVVPGHGSIV